MRVSVNQPAFMPWMGYFKRIMLSDIHIVLDDVQFEKNSMTNRNKILMNGKKVMLTIPLRTKNRFGNLMIDSIEVDNSKKWVKKHLASIHQSYSKAPFYREFMPIVEQYYYNISIDDNLGCVLSKNFHLFLKYLEINTEIVNSSNIEHCKVKSDLILELCKNQGAKEYISGPLGRDYLNISSFQEAEIKVTFHEYVQPNYNQIKTREFISHLSVIDVIFNHGKKTIDII